MSQVIDLYDETISLPRAVRFPVELRPPVGFDPEQLGTWPKLDGRLEYVDGRLLYMPPCGDIQAVTVADVLGALLPWIRAHDDFVLGTNEAGMRIEGATRGADAAIWRRADSGLKKGTLWRTAPLLAVEVAGVDDPEAALREKAAWYRGAGVPTVWIVLPDTREVLVISGDGEQRFGRGATLPAPGELAGLEPAVDALFTQLG